MSRHASDEFNFVGLARSPVKQTPKAGYYSAGGAFESHAGLNEEPSSAATTERMSSTGGSSSSRSSRSSSSSGGPSNSSVVSHHQRREVLQPVARNVLLDTSALVQTPVPSFVSFSSLSNTNRKISSSASSSIGKPSSLPVSRTLKLSPDATDVGNNAVDYTVNRRFSNVNNQSTPYRSGLFSADPSPIASREEATPAAAPAARPVALLTPRASESAAATATASRRRASPSPVVLSAMDSPATTAAHVQQQQQQQHQQPSTPAMLDPYLSSCSAAVDSTDDAGEWSDSSFDREVAFSPDPATPATRTTRSIFAPTTTVGTIYEDHEQMTESPIGMTSINSSPGWTTTNLRGGSGVTPLPPATGGGQGHSRSAPRERSTTAMNNNNNSSDNSTTGMTPVAASLLLRMSAGRSTTPGSRHGRSAVLGPIACAVEDASTTTLGGVAPDTPAAGAEAVLAVMGGAAAVGACGTYVQEEGALEDDKEEEEELFPHERSQVSMDVQVQPRATSPGSATRTTRRPMTTPRRPIAASTLLELSQGTPRHMIRGIISGVAPAGTPHHRQQRFVPQVTKVVENSEEETPRRFIRGMVGNRQADGTKAAAACSAASIPAFGSLHPRSSSTADAAAAAAAAAAGAAATTAAVAAAAAELSEDSGDNVDGEGPAGVLQIVAAPTRAAPAPIAEVGVTISAHAGGRQRPDTGFGMGKAILSTIMILSVTFFVCFALFGFLVLVCIAFAGPPLTVPIH